MNPRTSEELRDGLRGWPVADLRVTMTLPLSLANAD